MTLRWQPQPSGGFYAYSGDIIVGMVVLRDHGQAWVYDVSAVSTRWIGKGHGEVKTVRAARRAVERVWNLWLNRANLTPCPSPAP